MKKTTSITLIVLASLVVLMVAVRMALPGLIKGTINGQLADMGEYRGAVADVDLSLWRGAYQLVGLEIVNKSESVPIPFFSVETIDLAISWKALLRGAVVAEVTFQRPSLAFVDSDTEADQTGEGTDWRETLQGIVPIRINQLDIRQGDIQFRNFVSEPPVDLRITQLNGSITDLNNVHRGSGSQPAAISLTGAVLGTAPIAVSGQFDPLGDFRDFNFLLKVTDIELTRLNDLAEAYGNFDFHSGSGDFFMELEAKDGQLQGYAKPLLDNVDIVDIKKDMEDGILSASWEAVVGFFASIFRNQSKDRIATEIEISGSLDNSDVSTWQAFISILHNAFVEAYESQFSNDSK